MRRTPLAVAAAALLFVAFVAWLFPADDVARRVLAGVPSPVVTFERAALRPRGIRLDRVAIAIPEASVTLHADRAWARPSVWSLVRGGGGLPWRIEAAICGGDVDATVAADDAPAATAVSIVFERAELASCPPLAIAGGALAGRAQGTARLRVVPGVAPEGEGTVEVRGATWRNPGDLPLLGTLHAETASVRWRLQDGLLVLDGIALAGPELSATGSGEVRFAAPIPESAVTLRLALTPGPRETGFLQLVLPPAAGTRSLTVAGRLGSPQVSLQ
ncbi:MAG TPA: type II secretion system protein GspN [Candidatus Binatia bacterium]|nr:type II secretion system protein GspN [Candidatus Binatia bacterium]